MHGTGHPIRVPVIDLAEVSAGGGTIAWIDPGGALRVGPESAGRGARARVLRPGRRAAHRHRRRSGARLSQPGRCWAARCRSTCGRRGRHRERLAAAARRDRGTAAAASWTWSTRAWRRASASSPSSAATTRASSRWWPSAAPARCTRRPAGPGARDPESSVPPIPGGFSALGLVATDFRRDYVKTFYARRERGPADVAAAYARMEAARRARCCARRRAAGGALGARAPTAATGARPTS